MTSPVNSAASIALAVGTESALADMAVFREGIRGLTAEIAQLAAVAKAVDISASLKRGLTGTSQSFTAEAEKANAGVAKTLSSGAGEKTGAEFGMGIRKGVNQQLDDLKSDTSKTLAKIRASFSVPLGNGARATQSVAIDSASVIGQALAAKAATTLSNPAGALAATQADEDLKVEVALRRAQIAMITDVAARESAARKLDLAEQTRDRTAILAMRKDLDARDAAQQAASLKNARFQTAPLQQQVRTVRTAAVFQQSEGPAATEDQFGKAAAGTITALPQLEAELARVGQAHTVAGEKARQHTQLLKDANGAMSDLHSSARGLAGSLDALWLTWGSAVPLIAAAAIGGALVGVFEKGKQAEFALAFIPALTQQAITLNDVLKATAGSVFTPAEGIEGLRALTQAGFDATQAIAAMPGVLRLAQVGQLNVGEAAKVAASAVHGFGLDIGDIDHVGDVFVKAASKSNQSVEVIADAMRQASTVADVYKVSFDQAAATIATLEKRNIGGAQAFTEIRNALKDLSNPTSKAADLFKQLNISAFDGKNLKDYDVLIGELAQKYSTLTEKSKLLLLNNAFDSRTAKGLGVLLADTDAYQRTLASLKDSTDFLKTAQEELGNTTEAAMKRAESALDATFVKAFQAASPAVQELLDSLAQFGRSDGFLSFLTSAIKGVADLTREITEHGTAIAVVLGSYALLRIALTTGTLLTKGLADAMSLLTREQRLSAVAAGEDAAAQTVSAAAKKESALASTSLAAKVGEGAVATGSWIGVMSKALGVIGLMIGAATALYAVYEILTARTRDSGLAQDESTSKIDTAIERMKAQTLAIDNNIRALREQRGELVAPRADPTLTSARDENTKQRDNLQGRLAKNTQETEETKNSFDPEGISVPAKLAALGKERQEIEAAITAQKSKALEFDREALAVQTGQIREKRESALTKVSNSADAVIKEATDKKLTSIVAAAQALKSNAGNDGVDLQKTLADLADLKLKADSKGVDVHLKDKDAIRQQNEAYKDQIDTIKTLYETQKRVADIDKQGALTRIQEQAKAHVINPTQENAAIDEVWKHYSDAVAVAAGKALESMKQFHRGDKPDLEQYDQKREARHIAQEKALADEQSAQQRITLELQQQLALKEQSSHFEGDLAGVKTTVEKRTSSNQDKFNEQFLSNADKAALEASRQAAGDYATELAKINKLLADRRALQPANGDNDPAIQEYLREIQVLKQHEAAVTSDAAAAARALELRNESFGAGVEKAFNAYAKAAEDKSKIAEQFVTSSIDRMTTALEDFANGKKVSIKSLFKDEAAEIIKVQLKVSTGGIAKQIQDAMGAGTGSGPGDGGFIGSALSVLFGGAGAGAGDSAGPWGQVAGAVGGSGGNLGSASQSTARQVLTLGQAAAQATALMRGQGIGGLPGVTSTSAQISQLNSASSGGIIGALFGKAGNALATSWNLRGGQSALGSTTSTPGGSINNAPAGTSYDTAFAADVPIAHTGGMVGGALRRHAPVSMAAFAGAPRYHTGGIASNEVPIIAQEGEGIFTRDQMANLAPAGKTPAPIQHSSVKQTNNFIVKNAPSRQSQSQMAGNVGRALDRRRLSRSS